MAKGSEPHLSGHAPTGGQQRHMYSLQRRETDSRQIEAQAEEKIEGSCHDQEVWADQGRIQQGQDVKELIIWLRLVALEDPQYLALTPNISVLQPGTTDTQTVCVCVDEVVLTSAHSPILPTWPNTKMASK